MNWPVGVPACLESTTLAWSSETNKITRQHAFLDVRPPPPPLETNETVSSHAVVMADTSKEERVRTTPMTCLANGPARRMCSNSSDPGPRADILQHQNTMASAQQTATDSRDKARRQRKAHQHHNTNKSDMYLRQQRRCGGHFRHACSRPAHHTRVP